MEIKKDVKDDREIEALVDESRKKDLNLRKRLDEANTTLVSWLSILLAVIILNVYTISTFKKTWTILGLLLVIPCIQKIYTYKYIQKDIKNLISEGETARKKAINFLSEKK